MDIIIFVVKHTVIVLLSVVEIAMLVRAVLSWFPIDGNKFTELLFAITEPFIHPIRVLFIKMNWFQGLPIDISFLVAYILISVVLTVLPMI
ncbi:MAG: YggT family protein [Ruminococcaceae bacterium]|nr:YggT family protein [Oscillospiraceae bacterium]